MIRQRGGVLIASLVVLMLLSLIGLSGAGSTTLEERMAGNFRDQRVAFEAAETALAAAERWVESQALAPITGPGTACFGSDCFDSSCTNGLCFHGTLSGALASECRHSPPVPGVHARDNALDVWGNPDRHRTLASADELTSSLGGSTYIVEFLCYVRLDPLAPPSADAHGSAGFFRDHGEMFRITAMGVGATPNARAVVQSTYRKVR